MASSTVRERPLRRRRCIALCSSDACTPLLACQPAHWLALLACPSPPPACPPCSHPGLGGGLGPAQLRRPLLLAPAPHHVWRRRRLLLLRAPHLVQVWWGAEPGCGEGRAGGVVWMAVEQRRSVAAGGVHAAPDWEGSAPPPCIAHTNVVNTSASGGRYLCPIGGMNGLFAKLSMTELRARQGVCSSACCVGLRASVALPTCATPSRPLPTC